MFRRRGFGIGHAGTRKHCRVHALTSLPASETSITSAQMEQSGMPVLLGRLGNGRTERSPRGSCE